MGVGGIYPQGRYTSSAMPRTKTASGTQKWLSVRMALRMASPPCSGSLTLCRARSALELQTAGGPGQVVDLGCQDEIVFRQAVDRMRPEGDLHLAPGEKEVGVVALFLRQLADAVHELKGLTKIGKNELLGDVVLVGHGPGRHLF